MSNVTSSDMDRILQDSFFFQENSEEKKSTFFFSFCTSVAHWKIQYIIKTIQNIFVHFMTNGVGSRHM